MTRHIRYICPVGQGGFSIETIGDMTIVYDCGSLSNISMLESCIDILSRKRRQVSYLFLSHFDRDHVNSLRYLLDRIMVKTAVISFIPKNMRVTFNIYSDNAYDVIMSMLQDSGIEVNEVEGGEEGRKVGIMDEVWEWIAKSMMSPADFSRIEVELKKSLDVDKLQDPDYVEKNTIIVNAAFKKVFGTQGPNAKGLIMLSQHCKGTGAWESDIVLGCRHCFHEQSFCHTQNSSCLYVGDADLKNNTNRTDVKAFLKKFMTDQQLELMQISHHGSSRNSSSTLDQEFPADIYFVNDRSSNRIQKNAILYKNLVSCGKLHVSRGNCSDLLITYSIK